MHKSKYTQSQIAFALKQAETGTPVSEVTRKMGVTEQTSGRMPGRELVLVIGGRPGQNQNMAKRLQRVQTTFIAGKQNTQRICPDRPGSPGLS